MAKVLNSKGGKESTQQLEKRCGNAESSRIRGNLRNTLMK